MVRTIVMLVALGCLLVAGTMAYRVHEGADSSNGRVSIASSGRPTVQTATVEQPTSVPTHAVLNDADGPPPTATATHPRPTSTRTVKRSVSRVVHKAVTTAKYVVLFVLDGAQPNYLHVSGIPHVRALMKGGTEYQNAWAGILESETPSGHATISSGSQPRNDGILSFDWANSDNIPVSMFNENAIRSGDMESVMNHSPAPSIASLVHKQNRKAKVVALSGYKYYAADAIGGPDADVIMYYTSKSNGSFGPTAVPGHMPPSGVLNDPALTIKSRSYPLGVGNHLAMSLADRTFKRMHQAVTLINLPEFDWPLGHVKGAGRDVADMKTLMRGFDRDLAAMEETYRKAGVLDQTLFILTADHGFTFLDHKMSHSVVNDAVAKAGTSIIRDTYHTAAYVWVKDESKASLVAENIAALQKPYIQSVYFRTVGANGPTYLRASGSDLFRAPGVETANQYLLNTFNGPNGPDVVVLTKERSSFVAGGESTWKGDHGGTDWESQHLPLVLSGPGIHAGVVASYPAPLMDVAPTLLAAMGMGSGGMQGIPLADALTSATAAQHSTQRTQGAVVRPVTDALKTESRLEIAAGQ